MFAQNVMENILQQIYLTFEQGKQILKSKNKHYKNKWLNM